MKMKILMVSAESTPIVKIGGLADVVGSLPKALKKIGCEVRVVIPAYKIIDKKKYAFKKIFSDLVVKDGEKEIKFNIWESNKAILGAVAYLIEDHRYFVENSVYIGNTPKDFLFFSLAVLKSLFYLNFKPDIIHCHDSHTALISALLKTKEFEKLKKIKTLYTIHNLSSQGQADPKIIDFENLTINSLSSFARDAGDGDINFMVQGIINSSLINTVSPTYAKEINTKEYGAGIEKIVKANKKKIFGILNGIDVNFWNPAKDKFIKYKYSSADLKIKNKEYLQKKLGLEIDSKIPLACFIGRLYSQKGIELISEETIKLPCQFVFLGTGDEKYENYLKKISEKYPKKVSVNIFFNEELAHQIYAGADIIIIPSLFEPCGLIQMIAMRYGAIPVARDTGGLSDTINSNTGFKFKEFSLTSFNNALKKALNIYYKNNKKWKELQRNCFKKDFSWNVSAKKYLVLYKRLLKK